MLYSISILKFFDKFWFEKKWQTWLKKNWKKIIEFQYFPVNRTALFLTIIGENNFSISKWFILNKFKKRKFHGYYKMFNHTSYKVVSTLFKYLFENLTLY